VALGSRRRLALVAARTLAGLRCLIGLGALARPSAVAAPWVGGDAAKASGGEVLGRALGGRDLALGALVLMSRSDAELARSSALGAFADSVDLAATLVAYRRLPKVWRVLVLASTMGAAVTGAGAATLLRRRP